MGVRSLQEGYIEFKGQRRAYQRGRRKVEKQKLSQMLCSNRRRTAIPGRDKQWGMNSMDGDICRKGKGLFHCNECMCYQKAMFEKEQIIIRL